MSAGIERLTGVVESLLVELTGVLGQAATLGLLAELRAKARAKAKADDMTFSQLMRRALRNELEGAGR